MNRAELAAEVLRIHDLIAAEPAPIDWHDIHCAIDSLKANASRVEDASKKPQPRIVDGIGLCSTTCGLYHPLDGISREHSVSGSCVALSAGTRVNVPCRPWVDGLLSENLHLTQRADHADATATGWKDAYTTAVKELHAALREVQSEVVLRGEAQKQIDELRQELSGERAEKAGILARAEHAEVSNRNLSLERTERIEARQGSRRPQPCGARRAGAPCGELTVARNTSGDPVCRPCGGR